jgi:1,3-beta-glucanosyltransferase GAS1
MERVHFSSAREEIVMRLVVMVRLGCMVWHLSAILVSSLSDVLFLPINTFTTATKLSFAMSQWFEANKRNPQACSFAGNGTVNSKASTASSAEQVANSCLAAATGTFVPTAPTAGSSGSSGSSGSPGSPSTTGSGNPNSSSKSAAETVLVTDARFLLGVFLMLGTSVAGGLLSLA